MSSIRTYASALEAFRGDTTTEFQYEVTRSSHCPTKLCLEIQHAFESCCVTSHSPLNVQSGWVRACSMLFQGARVNLYTYRETSQSLC